MSDAPQLIRPHEKGEPLVLAGAWRLAQIGGLETALQTVSGPVKAIDARGIDALDAAGALLLLRLLERFALTPDDLLLQDDHQRLIKTLAAAMAEESPAASEPAPFWLQVPERLGSTIAESAQHALRLIAFLGLSLQTLAATVFKPGQWRITATVHHMQKTGLDALPLVALLSFLVGAVVAFLGATVLRDFGAELFVVDLTTFAFLREFGVLLTAILLAGRTASAFTAQIGTMKSREEIDAIRTLGLDPIVLLVLPRLIALLIMLPLLSVVATLSGLLGGLAVATLSLGLPVEMYINRVYETATLSHYLTGLSKAPLFALVIALVGCLEGFKVTGTAQSVGERTTSAVVQSISLVIVINAFAAVFFMEMGW